MTSVGVSALSAAAPDAWNLVNTSTLPLLSVGTASHSFF